MDILNILKKLANKEYDNITKVEKTNDNVVKSTHLLQSNYIEIKRNKESSSPHKFHKIKFVQNNKIIVDEKESLGCLLCTVDYGKSVTYILGKNSRYDYGECFKEFEKPFENYFLIFIKGVDVSDTMHDCHIIDPYDFYTIVIHNDKTIENKLARGKAPLINTYNKLLWDEYKTNSKVINIEGKNYLNIRGLHEFNKYLGECSIRENNYILIYFHKMECLSFYMVYELCKTADSFEILSNKFEDDIDTRNYCAKFSKDRIEDIALIHYCIDKRGLGNSIYYSNLYGSKSKGYGCAGSAIYNTPYSEYIKGLNWITNYKAQFILSDEQRNNFKELVKFVYKKYNLPLDYTKLPDEFTKELVLEDDFLDKLKEFVYKNYYNYTEYAKIGPAIVMDQTKSKIDNDKKQNVLKQKYQELKQDLIKKKIYSTKWKSELDLFKLVYSYFPDAIYQYRETWLGLQSIDIFIPSKKLAFEYQGQQHYAAIDFWGGQEGFEKRQMLDEQKRKLCKENNVKLIEWRYDEPISKIMLDKKLENL